MDFFGWRRWDWDWTEIGLGLSLKLGLSGSNTACTKSKRNDRSGGRGKIQNEKARLESDWEHCWMEIQ